MKSTYFSRAAQTQTKAKQRIPPSRKPILIETDIQDKWTAAVTQSKNSMAQKELENQTQSHEGNKMAFQHCSHSFRPCLRISSKKSYLEQDSEKTLQLLYKRFIQPHFKDDRYNCPTFDEFRELAIRSS